MGKLEDKEMVNKSTWLKGQEDEKKFHDSELLKGIQIYWNTYYNLFKYVGVEYSQMGKSILEIGPAEFPALYYVRDFHKSFIIEPLQCRWLPHFADLMRVTLINKPAEDVVFPEVNEVWLFNVLTHTMDPDMIIEKAKEKAETIRFFEPINQVTNASHFHNFPLGYFVHHFGTCVKHYPANQGIPGFHEHECAYGVYKV